MYYNSIYIFFFTISTLKVVRVIRITYNLLRYTTFFLNGFETYILHNIHFCSIIRTKSFSF